MGHKCLHSKIQRIVTSENHIEPITKIINGQRKRFIYWHIDEEKLTTDFEKHKVINAFTKAFKVWDDLFLKQGIDIRFESTSNRSEAAFILKFRRNGDDDLPKPFDEDTIAYNYLPTKGQNLGYGADMYINDALDFAEMHKPAHFNLFAIVVHEIGHGLGLYHSEVQGDIMGAFYIGDNPVLITQDTIDGIVKLYNKYIVQTPTNPKLNLPEMFPSYRSVKTMHENSIVVLGQSLGLDVKMSDRSKDSARKVFNYIHQIK